MALQKTIVAIALATLSAACSPAAEETAPTKAPTTTVVAPTSTTQGAITTTQAPSTTAASTTTTSAITTTTEAQVLPEQAELTHGGESVGVYLKVIEEADSSGDFRDDFADVVDAVEAMGYFAGFGDLGCDEGAQEALGLGEGVWYGASLYFDTETDANLFVAAYPDEVVGIATIVTFCLD